MKNLVVLMFLISVSANAQSRIPFLAVSKSADNLTGVLSQDLFARQTENMSHDDSLLMLEKRSSLKAGFFSLLVPGGGQVYNGGTANYIKAAGFLAIEAAAIAVNIIWTNKGNDKTNYFQNYADGTSGDNYADGHYSVLRYAQWIKNNLNTLYPNASQSTINLVNEMFRATGPAPWQKVDFAKLNQVEVILGQTSTAQFFTHQLPAHGQQQYYELIGKYAQFREGWYDENLSFTNGDQLNTPTTNSGYYMGQREDANNLYGVAGTAIGVVIANHFVSAIEAALWAHGHNKMVQTSVGVSPIQVQGIVAYQTQVNVAVNF